MCQRFTSRCFGSDKWLGSRIPVPNWHTKLGWANMSRPPDMYTCRCLPKSSSCLRNIFIRHLVPIQSNTQNPSMASRNRLQILDLSLLERFGKAVSQDQTWRSPLLGQERWLSHGSTEHVHDLPCTIIDEMFSCVFLSTRYFLYFVWAYKCKWLAR